MTLLQSGLAKSLAEDYTIDQSLRIEKSSRLTKTLAGDGNKTTWTWSGWTKNAFDWSSTADNTLFSAIHTSGAASGRLNAYFRGQLPDTYFEISQYQGSYSTQMATNAVYRDPGAWLHVVVVWDTDNGVTADNIRIWINGERITSFRTENLPSDGEESSINEADCTQAVGAIAGDDTSSIASYLAEVHFIDGIALDADSFGETDSTTNQWKPIEYSGSYGTNGFYQKYAATELANSFEDSSDFEDLTFTPSTSLTVDYLIVAGGGGGSTGNNYNGGGGAGGYRTGTGVSVTAQDYTIVVGSGGVGGSATYDDGGDSSALGFSATGGGGKYSSATSRSGGSGAGGYGYSSGATGGTGNAGSYSPVEGYNGGTGGGPNNGGGGGGGGSAGVGTAGNDGRNGSSGTGNAAGGDGGAGTSTDFNGASTYYAAGAGGAGGWVDNPGGGHTAGQGAHGSDGTGYSSTGYGMGGGRNSTGGAGTNGVVMIKYANASAQATGGTITSYTDGGTTYQVHTFTVGHSAHTITAVGDVANTRAQQKYGDSSIYFDGSGDYLTAPDSSDWDVFGSSSDDWTIDFYVKHSDHVGSETYIGQTEDSSNYWNIGHYHSGGIWFGVKQGGSWIIDSSDPSYGPEITDTNWHHVALCKVANEYGIYLDGAQGDYVDDSSTDTLSGLLGIGTSTWDGTSRDFDGYMDQIRIQSSNVFSASPNVGNTDTITVPTAQPSADSDTKLLINSNWDGGLGLDSSGEGNSFTPSGLVATDQMEDSPTNNFATINPLDGNGAYSEGNLKVVTPA